MTDYKHKLKEYKDFLYPIFLLGLILFLLKNFFLPKVSEIFAFRETIKVKEEQIKDLNSHLAYLQELTTSSLEVEEEILNYALPFEKEIVSLIITYEGLGKAEGISLEPLSLKPGMISPEDKRKETSPVQISQKDSAIKEIPFEMKVEAENKDEAKRFLREIFLSRRILDIKDLKWSIGEEEEKISLDLSLVAYYFPETQVTTSPQLVEREQNQTNILEKLRKTKVYEEEILELIPTKKEDLFSL